MNSRVSVTTTGLLSDGQRAFLRDDRDEEVADPDQYERKIRHQARKRAANMGTDLELLERTGHEDIVAEFYYDVLLVRVFQSADLPESDST